MKLLINFLQQFLKPHIINFHKIMNQKHEIERKLTLRDNIYPGNNEICFVLNRNIDNPNIKRVVTRTITDKSDLNNFITEKITFRLRIHKFSHYDLRNFTTSELDTLFETILEFWVELFDLQRDFFTHAGPYT